jgi:hypothetical protein
MLVEASLGGLMRTLALALALAGVACAQTEPLTYGPHRHAADAAAPDAAAVVADASSAPADGGSTARDAGHLPPDAGITARDAGHVPPDAGRPCVSCVPDCHGAICGPDGCGGSCGSCTGGYVCLEFGDHPTCGVVDVPNCTGRECGGDGLGGLCGVCPASWQCGFDAICRPPGGGCGPVGAGGTCIGGIAVACQGGALVHTQCQFDACEVDASGIAACKGLPCIPDCFGMACGDDGCGGSCGTCSPGEECRVWPSSHLGTCLGAAPSPGLAPVCTGGTLVEWQSSTVATVSDCLAKGMVCDDGCQPAACRPPGRATPCDGLPAAGHCAGDYLFKCVGGLVTVRHCRDWGWGSCKRVDMERFDCSF